MVDRLCWLLWLVWDCCSLSLADVERRKEERVRVFISGGGTGGHVYPLLVVAEALKKEYNDSELVFVGSSSGLEEGIVSRTDLPFRAVDSGPIRGASLVLLAKSVRQLWRGYRQSQSLIRELAPDVVLTSGGYVGVPVVIAAWQRGIPVMVYLPDLEPGLAVRLQSRFARRVAVSFDRVLGFFSAKKAWVSGYPVRTAILEAKRDWAMDLLGLDPALRTLFVLGGSRGARSLNEALTANLVELLDVCQIVHMSGQLDWEWVQERRAGLPADLQARYTAYPYLHGEQMPAALAAADLVVARAGAATTGEFPAAGLPSILVPYPYSGQHQRLNADFMVEHGAAVSLADGDLGEQLKPTVLRLLNDPQALAQMGERARALSKPQAAHDMAKELARLASEREEMAR